MVHTMGVLIMKQKTKDANSNFDQPNLASKKYIRTKKCITISQETDFCERFISEIIRARNLKQKSKL